jgi:YVTN family beta-propeller protein
MKLLIAGAALVLSSAVAAYAGLLVGRASEGAEIPPFMAPLVKICAPAINRRLADKRFVNRVDEAMTGMMSGMSVAPSGDVDKDFVATMVPHHIGAIRMAEAQLLYGHNARLERIAEEIIVTQQQEISAMRLALDKPSVVPAPGIPASHRDRVYSAEQFSNTVSVTDPVDGKLLGVIRLGQPLPGNLSPLYTGQLLVHGMGFSPDHRTLAVVSIGSNSVSFIDTATNRVKHVTYVGRSPHEAFFSPNGSEVWVTVRGENYVSVLDSETYREKTRIIVPNGPGMTIFSPDGKYGYVCSSFTPETVVIDVSDHRTVGRVAQASPFCPNIAATPDGKQVWFTLKDTGKVEVFNARPPFNVLETVTTGPITNHVNIVRNAHGQFAYVTIGGLNEVKVFRTSDYAQVATIPVGALPHGIWPSGDGTRVAVGLENDDELAIIDTLTNRVISTNRIGQAPQAVVYVPDAVPSGTGLDGLYPLGIAGSALHIQLRSAEAGATGAVTSVSLFDQGILQVVQAAVAGLRPRQPYVLALANHADGNGKLEPLAAFKTNAAGSAIVNTTGPIQQVVQGDHSADRRYLVIAPGTMAAYGNAVQVQVP